MKRWAGVVVMPVGLSSCFTARYLSQAVRGQAELLFRAKPIESATNDPSVSKRSFALLAQVPSIKAFGVSQGLKPTRNYAKYVELNRSAVVWVVQGCHPLKFESKRWWFPVVGSVPYLGFFDQDDANAFASQLETNESIDVYVRSAGAYSTLGWFHDPLLSTMLAPGDDALGALANVVFHESVHATLYISDQSAFNESLASFVADRLTPQWLLAATHGDSRELHAWESSQEKFRVRMTKFRQTYDALSQLYASDKSDENKRSQKRSIYETLEMELKVTRPLNNAALTGIKTYDTGQEAFERLLAACDRKWPSFFQALSALSQDDFGRKQRIDFESVIDALIRRQ